MTEVTVGDVDTAPPPPTTDDAPAADTAEAAAVDASKPAMSKEQHARAIRADRNADDPAQSLLDALEDYMVLCGGDHLADVRDPPDPERPPRNARRAPISPSWLVSTPDARCLLSARAPPTRRPEATRADPIPPPPRPHVRRDGAWT